MNKAEAILYSSVHNPLVTPSIEREIMAMAKKIRDCKLLRAPLPEFVGKLTDFEFVYTDRECGGYFSQSRKEIALHTDGTDAKRVICHELGHFIQISCNVEMLHPTLSQQVSFEQQCETIAYRLYSYLYPYRDYRTFSAYFKPEDHRFLSDWYGGWLQDDLFFGSTK